MSINQSPINRQSPFFAQGGIIHEANDIRHAAGSHRGQRDVHADVPALPHGRDPSGGGQACKSMRPLTRQRRLRNEIARRDGPSFEPLVGKPNQIKPNSAAPAPVLRPVMVPGPVSVPRLPPPSKLFVLVLGKRRCLSVNELVSPGFPDWLAVRCRCCSRHQ